MRVDGGQSFSKVCQTELANGQNARVPCKIWRFLPLLSQFSSIIHHFISGVFWRTDASWYWKLKPYLWLVYNLSNETSHNIKHVCSRIRTFWNYLARPLDFLKIWRRINWLSHNTTFNICYCYFNVFTFSTKKNVQITCIENQMVNSPNSVNIDIYLHVSIP